MTTPVVPDACWPVDTSCDPNWDSLPTETQVRASALAVATLRRLTAYRVGGCPVTVRPCRQRCAQGFVEYRSWPVWGSGFNPLLLNGQWINNGCMCQNACECTSKCKITLVAPVSSVSQVKMDGNVLVEGTDYAVVGADIISLADGDCTWPTCQNLALPDTEVGTLSITYVNGYEVDALGAWAAGMLASEFAKACSGAKCKLPTGVTSVTRNGVSFEVVSGMFTDGWTGLREVDAYIGIWNPNNLQSPALIWSPDIR